MLRQNPITRWPILINRHLEAQKSIADIDHHLKLIDDQHVQWQIQTVDPDPRTIILVIGESGNRDNWGLYGYPRDTTRPLAKALNELSGPSVNQGTNTSHKAAARCLVKYAYDYSNGT